MKPFHTSLCLVVLCALSAGALLPEEAPLNPVLAGADPHVLAVGGVVWLYPTHYGPTPTRLYAYSSHNLQEWKQHGPILDLADIGWIKEDGAPVHMAWAPCIAERNGRYYLYYSVGPQNPTPSRPC